MCAAHEAWVEVDYSMYIDVRLSSADFRQAAVALPKPLIKYNYIILDTY